METDSQTGDAEINFIETKEKPKNIKTDDEWVYEPRCSGDKSGQQAIGQTECNTNGTNKLTSPESPKRRNLYDQAVKDTIQNMPFSKLYKNIRSSLIFGNKSTSELGSISTLNDILSDYTRRQMVSVNESHLKSTYSSKGISMKDQRSGLIQCLKSVFIGIKSTFQRHMHRSKKSELPLDAKQLNKHRSYLNDLKRGPKIGNDSKSFQKSMVKSDHLVRYGPFLDLDRPTDPKFKHSDLD